MTSPESPRVARLAAAAMEPAAGGRDDQIDVLKARIETVEPQWSPPLVGGMTYVSMGILFGVIEPQWSPPLVGGMT